MDEGHWDVRQFLRPTGAVVFASWAGTTTTSWQPVGAALAVHPGEPAPVTPLWRRLVSRGRIDWLLGR
jgi:hypothetical protein